MRTRRWVAGIILSLFVVAVAGAASIGWWYARESPAHQGPIVLISVDGVPAAALPPYGALRTDMPAISMLAADAVVFDRAYAHSPQTLPAHASMLTGQLPLEHGVRDDAGFALEGDARTLAEMLRNRGFTTGGAVSTYLLRPESGVAQGFTYFDAELPSRSRDTAPVLERDGAETVDAAARWIRTQDDQRFFVFVQVGRDDADAAVTRLAELLKSRRLYDDATIVLIGDRGDPAAGLTLDDATLRVPLIVKQPAREGAGRRVGSPVQQIDLVPTILDLVRAPVPGDLRGRSLRPVLDDGEAHVAEQPLYAESMAAWHRFGGHPLYAMTSSGYRYIRGGDEDLVSLVPRTSAGGGSAETGLLRRELDRLLASARPPRPEPIPESEEERYALFGYLGAPRLVPDVEPPLSAAAQPALAEEHRAAALLIGQKKYSAGIRALQRIVRDHPELTTVHYQIGMLLVRTGRLDEAIASFRRARELQPAASDVALALADALVRAGQAEAAQEQAAEAIVLAQGNEPSERAAAYEMAARVALARRDAAAAVQYAESARETDPSRPVPSFVRGRLLYDQGEYEKAAAELQDAVAAIGDDGAPLAELHLYLAESLTHLDRYVEAESHYRTELRAFPRNVQAYAGLAMLYRASNRHDDVEDVLNELVAGTPTPEGYAVAARLWTILGDPSRAEALRSDAQVRFRGDPQPALLGRGGRR